ncbi:MAG: sec-independent protein translocase protein TatC [Gammaproteobacteria bacterium]|jgi:sec-independent protein translocase protein TatC
MNSEPDNQDSTDSGLDPSGEMSFVAHLIEVRNRLVKVLAVVVVLLLGLFPFANDLYLLLAEPLLRHMPAGTSMIATEVASPFLTPFKLALVCALFLAMPAFLYHMWAFVAPGLYKHEQKLVYPLLITSSLLFYLGMAFAYYVVFPLMFGFFSATAPEGVAIMTDIAKYLDFVLKIFFAFGVAFEVPIVTILLVWAGFTTPEELGKKRPYVVVGAFVLGMLLTPPDAISQTLLAIPMWILFELGLIFSKVYVRRPPKASDDEDAEQVP